MKILNNLELISSKIKLGDNVLELPKKDGVIATLEDLSCSKDVVFGKIESDSISTSCVFVSGPIESNNIISAVCGLFGNVAVSETLCVETLYAKNISINDKPVATQSYVDTCILTLEGEVQDAVDELSAKISSVYKYVGSVETEAALKALDTTNLNNGDVYNVTATDENWALIKTETETKWDKLGSTIDLAPYALKSDVSGCIAAVEAKIPTDFYTTSQADTKFEKAGCVKALEDSLRSSIHTNSLDVCGTSETTFTVRERDVTRFLINTKDELIKTEYPIQYTGQDICISSNYCCSCYTNPILVTDKAVIDYVDQVGETFDKSGCASWALNEAKTFASGCVNAVEDKIPTDYLPATKTDGLYDASSAHLCLFALTVVCGASLPKSTRIGAEEAATKKYVDDTVKTVEDKIPTDYLKVEVSESGETGVKSSNITFGCAQFTSTEETKVTFHGTSDVLFYNSPRSFGNVTYDDNLTTKEYVDGKVSNLLSYTTENDPCGFSGKIVSGPIRLSDENGGLNLDLQGGVLRFTNSSGGILYTVSCGSSSPVYNTDLTNKKYVDDQISTIEGKIPTNYLPATSDGVCGHHVDYFVNSSVKFKNTLKATTFEADYGSFTETLSFNGKAVATVDQIPTDFYTTYQADTKFEKSGCSASALSDAKSYTDEKISALGSVMEYKGNKKYGELPTTGNEIGDVYNITEDYFYYCSCVKEKIVSAGDNVVWNGSEWDVLSGAVDLTGYYDKGEVDEKLEGYLPVTTESGNGRYVFNTNVKHLGFYSGNVEMMRLCGNPKVLFPVLPETYCYIPTADEELTPKKYVDDSISTLESVMTTDYATKVELQSTVDNGVLTEDIALTGGTLSGDQFSWEIAPTTGMSKLLAVVTMDADGNIVTPTYKWDKTAKKVKVTVYSTTAISDNTYTTTITYKK